MATSRMIYFKGDLLERATEGVEKGDISKRINDLIHKGLLYEEQNPEGKVGLKEVTKYLLSIYNKKHPNEPLT